jgi:hypothetical protein
MTSSKRQALLSAAETFCDAFAQKKSPDEIFTHFSASDDVLIEEHGLSHLVPFLGREFRGQSRFKDYFACLSDHLSYENMRFSNFIVDTETSKVSVKGQATFTWTKTGQSWDEIFTYQLEFDDKNKVKVYEIWADTAAAYLASKGQLDWSTYKCQPTHQSPMELLAPP